MNFSGHINAGLRWLDPSSAHPPSVVGIANRVPVVPGDSDTANISGAWNVSTRGGGGAQGAGDSVAAAGPDPNPLVKAGNNVGV